MGYIAGYGGTVTLNFQSGSPVTYPVRNIQLQIERASLDVTLVSDWREKRLPGRVRRTATFDMLAQDGASDDPLREHVYPTSLANAVNRSVVLAFTDQGSKAYTLTGHIVSASRTDDGSGAVVWSLTLEES
jgi:hypothetical protein